MIRQKIVLRTAPHGQFREGFGDVPAENQDRDIGSSGEQPVERFYTLTIRQGQVEQDGGDSFLAQAVETSGEVANPFNVEQALGCCGERRTNTIGSLLIILNQKYFGSRRRE